MGINNIGGFLKKFRKLKPSDAYIKDAFISTIDEFFNEKIDRKEIDVQKGTVYLRVHPTLKSEVYIKKEKILETINKKLEKDIVKNII